MLSYLQKGGVIMTDSKLRNLSTDFAVKVNKMCDGVKGHYSLVNQLERSSTSIGANIHEADYAHSKADFVAKFHQLFCTKDVLLTSKDDVIELMDYKGYDSFFEREVSSISCCDGFIYQSDDCYTYNDYLYHLQKTNWCTFSCSYLNSAPFR